MRGVTSLVAAAAICATAAFATSAGAGNPGISDQSYSAGKYGGTRSASVNALANCPREYRGMYRGDLYCRQPAYPVIAPRNRLCPEGYRGMYRGDLYCNGRD